MRALGEMRYTHAVEALMRRGGPYALLTVSGAGSPTCSAQHLSLQSLQQLECIHKLAILKLPHYPSVLLYMHKWIILPSMYFVCSNDMLSQKFGWFRNSAIARANSVRRGVLVASEGAGGGGRGVPTRACTEYVCTFQASARPPRWHDTSPAMRATGIKNNNGVQGSGRGNSAGR